MYTRHFGLTAEPFSLTPDPEFLYLSAGHAEALAAMKVGLLGKRGLMVMTGEVGTGKTTLLYALLRALGEDIRTAYVSNTAIGFDGLLRLALSDFGVTPASAARVDMLTAVNHFLRDCAERGVTATLIVDEAQNLDAEAFEQLRLLSNFETFTHKLLQLVLVGQVELEARLRDPALRALCERVAVHCRLATLSRAECRAYVDYRLQRAGGSTRLFERDARELLLDATAGLPRRINILFHNALLFAYGRGAARVTLPVAQLAVAERVAFLQGAATPEPPRADATPLVRRRPRLALALGAAALAVAALRGPLWLSRPGAVDPPPTTALDPRASAQAAVEPRAGAGEPAAAGEPAVVSAAPAGAAEVEAELANPPADGAERAGDDHVASAGPQSAASSAGVAGADAQMGSDASPPEPAARAEGPAPVPATELAADVGAPLRTVRVERGSTLGSLARQIYGDVDAELIRRIQSVNPQIVDPNVIISGDFLRLPEIGPGEPAARKDEHQ